jgi:hypothetical protein
MRDVKRQKLVGQLQTCAAPYLPRTMEKVTHIVVINPRRQGSKGGDRV